MSETYYSLKVLLDGGEHYSVRYAYFKTEEERERFIKEIKAAIEEENTKYKQRAVERREE